jgi:hypothetical protein
MHCLIRWWGWGWQVCWHCWCWWHEDWQAPLEWVVGWWFGAWCAAQEFSVADGDSAIAIQFDAILVILFHFDHHARLIPFCRVATCLILDKYVVA